MAKMLGLLLKHLFPRLLFLGHALMSMIMVVEMTGDMSYLWLAICLLLIVIEGVYVAIVRRGRELDWVCPSAFLYCIVLITTLAVYRMKSVSCILDDIADDQCQTQFKPDSLSAKLFSTSSDQQRASVIEQTGVLVLIIGRWLLPKGSISREQFSQILLIYVGTAADIVEVSELFGDDKVKNLRAARSSIYSGLMVVWGWSVLQFSLTIALPEEGLKSKDEEDEGSTTEPAKGGAWRQTNHVAPMSYMHYKAMLKQGWNANQDKYRQQKDWRQLYPTDTRHDSTDQAGMDVDACPHADDVERAGFRLRRKDIKDCFMSHLDLVSILIPVVMQDGPFFIFRFVLIVHFNVVTEMIILLTCKNALVVVVQMYRILIMYCVEPKETEPDIDDPSVRLRIALKATGKLSAEPSLHRTRGSIAIQAISRMQRQLNNKKSLQVA